MIRAVLFIPETQQLTTGGPELEDRWRASDTGVLWLDLDGESEEARISVFGRFEIHRLAVQDALRSRHPPKYESFDHHLFLLLRGLDAQSTTVNFGVIQLAIFVGDRFIITSHTKPSVSANACYAAIESGENLLDTGPGGLAIRLWNRIARRYIQILLDLEPRLDAIEQEVFANPNDRLLAELTSYKSKLRQITRIARYHEHVLSALRLENPDRVSPSLRHEINDLSEQIERTSSLADLYYNAASDLIDGYLAVSSHRLNGVMRVLTIITVLFVPLTFIAGIYGMNFENMPELRSGVGYFVVIGVMLVIAILQLLLFKRKGWL